MLDVDTLLETLRQILIYAAIPPAVIILFLFITIGASAFLLSVRKQRKPALSCAFQNIYGLIAMAIGFILTVAIVWLSTQTLGQSSSENFFSQK